MFKHEESFDVHNGDLKCRVSLKNYCKMTLKSFQNLGYERNCLLCRKYKNYVNGGSITNFFTPKGSVQFNFRIC